METERDIGGADEARVGPKRPGVSRIRLKRGSSLRRHGKRGAVSSNRQEQGSDRRDDAGRNESAEVRSEHASEQKSGASPGGEHKQKAEMHPGDTPQTKAEKKRVRQLEREVKRNVRRDFREALKMELRQNKRSFIVYRILDVLVVISMIRMILIGNYEGAALCVLTLALLILPALLEMQLRVEIPQALEIILYLFIFSAEILGEVNHFYTIFPNWDTILHTLNGFMAAAVGLSLAWLLNADDKITFNLSPVFLAIVAFCFSMTIGVVWEFFEFSMDSLFGLDMQKDTVVSAISSVMLDPTGSQTPVRIDGIDSVVVNGQDLGLGGYLDIGLIDTMADLFVNLVGALVFSLIGFFALKHDIRKSRVAENLVLSRKAPENDFLERVTKDNAELKEASEELYEISGERPAVEAHLEKLHSPTAAAASEKDEGAGVPAPRKEEVPSPSDGQPPAAPPARHRR
jgi:hypothetical protein